MEIGRRTMKTMVIDKGLGRRQTEDLLETAGAYVDWIKLAFGTSVLYPADVLAEKIRLASAHDIGVYPGGTLLEKTVLTGDAEQWIADLPTRGFRAVEISEGTIDMSRATRNRLIQAGKAAGLLVFTEVGKKDPTKAFAAGAIIQAIWDDVEAGSDMVIIEGRDSGKSVGIYDDDGRPKEALIDAIVASVGDAVPVMWEAPLSSQHVFWVRRIGRHVALGNVQPTDVLSLEAVRRGLRSDTMLADPSKAGL